LRINGRRPSSKEQSGGFPKSIEDALNGLIVLKNETAHMKSSRLQSIDRDHAHMN
jgi:hypothetical protein